METAPNQQSIIEAVLGAPGVAVIIGDTDTGKSTLARELANAAVSAGVSTAVVDADLGQSELGPPATISMAFLGEPVESLRTVKPRRMYFVGSTSPVEHMLPTVIGVKRMVDIAIARGSQIVIADTSGLVRDRIGRTLKLHKIDILRPKHIIGLQKASELDHILSVVSRIDDYAVHTIKVSEEVGVKQPTYRTSRRESRFFEYFKDADRQFIRLDDIVCWGSYFTTGRLVRWQHFRVLERILETKVLHAEVVAGRMYIVVECRPGMAGVEALRKHYGARQFSLVCGRDFTNVLVGLADAHGNTLGLGLIEALDFKQRRISVLTPMKTVTPVRIVQLGVMRVRPDGVEEERIRPGEI